MKCCMIGCRRPAIYWVGKTDYDATHACQDHVEALKADGDEVWRLWKDGNVDGSAGRVA